MLDSLISTKFHKTLSMGRLTPRPRLDAKLNESLQAGCRLAMVTAPAGFGKSTLVSAWIETQKTPFSWLSLDSSDNDPKQFLSYFVGALQKIDQSLGMDQISRIQTADSADSEAVYTDVMIHLINQIALLSTSFILVLDDCHLLKNPISLQLLIFLIECQPQQMHMILISREDLPIPVSRLRVRRQLVEIRQADLQFSTDEAGDFFRECMRIDQLTIQEIAALEQRTEGWIAGLQLAGLSLKTDPDPAQFVKSFTGSDRYILDYLMDEVFKNQPAEIQKFLLATSILDRFCAPLCDSLLEVMQDSTNEATNRARTLLDQVEHSNLFLIPLDYHREWYRYHHLFSELLRHFLSQTAPQKIRALHLRASQWLEKSGLIRDAVKHAFQAEDWIYAAELVERHAWNMILHSQVSNVSEWCRTFPEDVIRQRPALCIFHAWALSIAFKKDDFPAAIIRIEQAEAALTDIDPDLTIRLIVGTSPVNLLAWATGQATLLRSFILMAAPRKQASPQALVELGQLSYKQLPPEDITGLSVSLLDICYASQARCDAEDAEKKFEHVIEVALSGGNYFGAVVAEYHRAHGYLVQGRLREVITFCDQKKRTYAAYFEHPLQELPAIALLDQAKGCALLELNERTEAEHFLRDGLEVGQWMPREELPGYLALARLCALKGDRQGITETFRRLEMRWPDIGYCSQAVQVLYELQFHPDDPLVRKKASMWAQANLPEMGPDIIVPGIGPAWNDEADYAVYRTWAEVQIILGKPVEGLNVIEPMLNVAAESKLIHRVIQLSLLKAQAFYVQGQRERVWQPLTTALSHAENKGYLNIIDQSSILIHLLTEAMKLGIAPNYIRQILEINNPHLDQVHSGHPQASLVNRHQSAALLETFDGLIEPLSTREIEVLTLMAQGLSNAEIAARLYLSPNTLKSHSQNIFGKLDVHSRIHAVNKARQLKLI